MHEEVVIDIKIYIICTAFPKIYYKNVLVRFEKTKESKIDQSNCAETREIHFLKSLY